MDHPVIDPQRYLAFQEYVIAIVRDLPNGFYLSGRAAASRGYLNHRLTFDVLFACNNQAEFGLWVEQAVEALVHQADLQVVMTVREARRLQMTVRREDLALDLSLLNDGPLHLGSLRSHAVLGRLDSPENIAAQAVVSIVNQAEPGDLADFLGLCVRFNLDVESLLQTPNSKATGVFAPDLARALSMAGKRDWELVRWIQPPPQAVYLNQLRKLAVRLLDLDESQQRPAESIQKANTLVFHPESSEEVTENIAEPVAGSAPAILEPAPVNEVEMVVLEEIPNPPSEVQRQDAGSTPAEPAVIKRGTGILNFYRALKAAGRDGFADTFNPGAPVEEIVADQEPAEIAMPEDIPTPGPVRRPSKPWSPTVVTGQVRPRSPKPPPAPQEPASPLVPQDLTPSDNRKEPRRRISYYVPVIDITDERPVGYLADISKSGLCLDCKGPLIKGSRLTLRIDLPPEMGPKSHMLFTAQVRWTRVDPTDPNAFNSGLEVINIANDDARSFIKIIEKYSYG